MLQPILGHHQRFPFVIVEIYGVMVQDACY
jgi:hypothetical protein